MQRFAFIIQYHGGSYFGWQKQVNQISVQEAIETVLNKLFNSSEISIIGCGRTDTGVHAEHYVFHVDLESKFDLEELKFKISRMFPTDISLMDIKNVNQDFHARFDAISRTYQYKINLTKSPFSAGLSVYYPKKLDISLMNEAASYLIGKKDFTSFSKLHTDVKTNICDVQTAKWLVENENTIYFEIKANRFLRNMVRAIVGSLLEVGIGNISPTEIHEILNKKDRSAAKMSAPAHGLYLSKIEYTEKVLI